LPEEEDAVYDDKAEKKVKVDESAGAVADGEMKISESAILMNVVVDKNLKNSAIIKEVSKPEEKTLPDAEKKVKLELDTDNGKQEIEIELDPIKRNISSFKNGKGEDVYFDVFTFVKTDKDGKPLEGNAKISKEDINSRCFRAGDVVYDISKPSPAETLDVILKCVLNGDDYKKIGNQNGDIKDKILRSLYTPDEVKKYSSDFEKFINTYDIFKDVNGQKVVDGDKVAKVFGDKFYMYKGNKYICFPTAVLTGAGSAVFAALFFSGAVVFPFALPVAVGILGGTGSVCAITGASAAFDKFFANRNTKRYKDLVKVREKSFSIFGKIKNQPKNKDVEKKENPPTK
jgi:hypothetical protein